MSLEISLSTLEISKRKRRYSGIFKVPRSVNVSMEEADPSSDASDSSLEILEDKEVNKESAECSSSPTSEKQPRRSTRCKIRPKETEKRRVILKPKKLSMNGNNLKEIEKYYLDKTVKRTALTLETIYEEPKESKEGFKFMSSKKYKRCLCFPSSGEISKNSPKAKKRKLKAKTVTSSNRIKNKKISIDYVIKYLEENHEQ